MRFRIIGTSFIIIGTFIFLFLISGHLWQRWETQKLIDSVEDIPFQQLNEQGDIETVSTDSVIPVGNVWGVLEIPIIDLETPIVEGVSAEQLRIAVGHLPESGELGESGQNFVVAGHRSSIFGQFFNRLDELEVGDRFSIRTHRQIFTYKIINKQIVDPHELDAIKPVEGQKRVTLLTCHPAHSSSHRLLIIGNQQEVSPISSS